MFMIFCDFSENLEIGIGCAFLRVVGWQSADANLRNDYFLFGEAR